MKLFDLSLKINGFPIDEAKEEFCRTTQIPENDFSAFLNEKRKQIVEFHLKNNSFYQKLTKNIETDSWQNLPVLTKKHLQIPLQDRLSNGFPMDKVFVNKTSGSSGDPFIFAKDKYCHALTWASNIYRFGWFGIDFNESLQARFYGIPLDFFGQKKERLKDFFANRYRFPVFDLSDKVLDDFLQVFRRKKFDYINGYTSSIVLFAKYLHSKKIILKDICPTLKVCIVTSEMLFEDDKKLMETQFGVPIVNEYGASELDLIAFENSFGEWQVNSETLFVEILDDDNQPVENGVEGKIVITSLYNKAHPFIRYEIGDRGILHPDSTLKKPILQQLTGRTNDFALLPSGKKAAGLTFYYITKSIIEDDGNVKEFIIKQLDIDRFLVEYVSEQELQSSQIEKIMKAVDLYLEPNLVFEFVRKSVLSRTNRGKLKQFEFLLKP